MWVYYQLTTRELSYCKHKFIISIYSRPTAVASCLIATAPATAPPAIYLQHTVLRGLLPIATASCLIATACRCLWAMITAWPPAYCYSFLPYCYSLSLLVGSDYCVASCLLATAPSAVEMNIWLVTSFASYKTVS